MSERISPDLRALSERIEQMREEERTRIARELHDELGQLLTGTKLDFASALKRLRELKTPGDVVDKLQSAIGQIDLGIAMVRRIATDLRPPALDHRDLGGAIEDEARRVGARAHLRITVVNRLEANIEPERATAIFRIFQEGLTNAIRHARATMILARVTSSQRRLVLYVRDNGVGISSEADRHPHSLGILGMRERARRVGGHFRIKARPGRGTVIFVSVPLEVAATD